jgi:predicted dehydrogenase
VHASYEALLADPAIEAVYNPLPNNLHAEWTIRAADAGKHVLCEKPLATSAAEAKAMFDAARRNNMYVVEGYPYRAQPQTIKLRELLREGRSDACSSFIASFGFLLTDASNIRMNPALAGGSLMDAGSYPISLVRMIAGERPVRVHAMARIAKPAWIAPSSAPSTSRAAFSLKSRAASPRRATATRSSSATPG